MLDLFCQLFVFLSFFLLNWFLLFVHDYLFMLIVSSSCLWPLVQTFGCACGVLFMVTIPNFLFLLAIACSILFVLNLYNAPIGLVRVLRSFIFIFLLSVTCFR
jgi:hypothetical protein